MHGRVLQYLIFSESSRYLFDHFLRELIILSLVQWVDHLRMSGDESELLFFDVSYIEFFPVHLFILL